MKKLLFTTALTIYLCTTFSSFYTTTGVIDEPTGSMPKASILTNLNTTSTDRVIVSPLTAKDCIPLAKYFKDQSIQEHFGDGTELSDSDAKNLLYQIILISEKAGPSRTRLFTVKDSKGEPIGAIHLNTEKDIPNCILVEFWIGKPFWGKALIPEAICSLFSQIATEPAQITFIYSINDKKCDRAISKIGEKLGAFTVNSKGEYIPSTNKSYFTLAERNIYRKVYSLLPGYESQINIKSYKNGILFFNQNFPMFIPNLSFLGSSYTIECIFSTSQPS